MKPSDAKDIFIFRGDTADGTYHRWGLFGLLEDEYAELKPSQSLHVLILD